MGDDGKGLAYDASKNGKAYAKPNGGYLTLKAGIATHVVVFKTPDGKTVTSMRVKDGQAATPPALADTTWLADPDMNFNADRWSGAFTAKGKRQAGRDDYAGSTTTKRVSGGATVRIDVDADYTDAKSGGGIGWQYIASGSSAWNGLRCASGAKCSSSTYSTFASDGTVQPFTQIDTWSDFGTAYVSHMQLT